MAAAILWQVFETSARISRVENKIQKNGFTLIEIVIAVSIFALLAVTSVTIFTNISRMSRKVQVQEYVFTEAEAAMEKILREIQRSTIDYDEYYSQLVLVGSLVYGQNYGVYGSTFYTPGSGGGPLTSYDGGGDGIRGGDCTYDSEYFFTEDCQSLDTSTYDVNFGVHPVSGDELSMNALCNTAGCDDIGNSLQSQLYLINSGASRKVMIALENFTNDLGDDESVISMLEMTGTDVDDDWVTDYWACAASYTCQDSVRHYNSDGSTYENYAVPEAQLDLEVGGLDDGDFEPITPSGMNVVELSFYIAPFEDPYRAFSETDQSVQQHPHVIVYMTVAPSSDMTQGFLGEEWTLTLQGTASVGVFDSVPSEYRGWWRYL